MLLGLCGGFWRCGGRGFLGDNFLGGLFARDEDFFGLGEREGFALKIVGDAAEVGDLLESRLAVPASNNGELFGQFAFAEDLDGKVVVGDEAGLGKGGGIDCGAGIESLEVADIDDVKAVGEIVVGKTALGEAAEDGGLATFMAALPVGAAATGTGALAASA
jgi:hypothetical protein